MNEQELIAAGFTPEEARAYLAAQPQTPIRQQAADALRTGAGAGLAALQAYPYTAAFLGAAGTVVAGEKATRSARATRRINQMVGGMGGRDAVEARLQEFEAAGRGDIVRMGDLSDEARTQADFAATHNPDVRISIAKAHEARQATAPLRNKQDVLGLAPAGAGGVPAPRSEIDLSGQAQSDFAKSDAGFEGLRKANPVIVNPQSFEQMLRQPENATLLAGYNKVRAKTMLSGGNGAPSFSTLHQMDRDLAKQVTAAFQSGDGDTARELKATRQRLLSEMEVQVGPKYRDVARQYRAYSQQQELLEAGLKFWNQPMQAEDVQRMVAALTPEELDVFRRGVTGGLLTKLDSSGRNVANEFAKPTPLTQAKLEVIFGSKGTLDQYMKRVAQERAMFLGGSVPGKGSQTAIRESEAAAEAGFAEGGDVVHALANPKQALGRFVADKVLPNTRVLARGTAKELAPWFMTEGAEGIRALLRSLPK